MAIRIPATLKQHHKRKLSLPQTIKEIQELSNEMADFWAKAHGWAPQDSADLLSKSRLDSFASLARSLDLTVLTPITSQKDLPGRLILGWANLGSLIECTLQLMLLIWLRDYNKNPVPDRRSRKAPKNLLPHELTLDPLRIFFNKHVWDAKDKAKWDGWILLVQQRRNAIHALKPRTLGTWPELQASVREYLEFLREIDGRLPYPD